MTTNYYTAWFRQLYIKMFWSLPKAVSATDISSISALLEQDNRRTNAQEIGFLWYFMHLKPLLLSKSIRTGSPKVFLKLFSEFTILGNYETVELKNVIETFKHTDINRANPNITIRGFIVKYTFFRTSKILPRLNVHIFPAIWGLMCSYVIDSHMLLNSENRL